MYPNQPVAAPQYPQQPQYAPAPAQQYPPQPYAPQQYPPQGYAQPQYAPAPAYTGPAAPPLPTGTLDGFYEQPSSGKGPSWKFRDANTQPMIGKTYAGVVARPVTNADVEVQTNPHTKQPVTFKDGRPKWQMVVPMVFPATAEYPDGQAGWYVKGQARDELARAMAEAGAPAGPPEAGAWVQVTLVSVKPIQGMSPQYIFRVEYRRPQGAAPVQQATSVPAAVQPLPGGPVEQYNNPSAPYSDPAYQTPQQVQFAPQAPMPQGVQVQPVQAPIAAPVVQAAPVSAPAAPQGMDASQAEIWARLTNQPAPQPQPQG